MSRRLSDSVDRQDHVLDLVSHGHTYDAIGRQLDIGYTSVTSVLHRAYTRLGAKSVAHAVRRGFETGVLIPGPSDVQGLRAENDTLRAEMVRVYAALVEANRELRAYREPGETHQFGDYLLGQLRAA